MICQERILTAHFISSCFKGHAFWVKVQDSIADMSLTPFILGVDVLNVAYVADTGSTTPPGNTEIYNTLSYIVTEIHVYTRLVN